jgi:DNA-binding transcriptional LysR family regulator
MIETYILQHLVAFADSGTLVAASEIVNVTQPPLTRSLQKLEDILGVQLFDRTKNTISLNQTGRLAVDYARRILALQNEMENEVLDFYNKTREIKIASIAPMPLYVLTQKFNKTFPKTKITGQMKNENDELFSLLEKDKAQIIITTINRSDERFFATEIFEEHLKVLLPKSFVIFK